MRKDKNKFDKDKLEDIKRQVVKNADLDIPKKERSTEKNKFPQK